MSESTSAIGSLFDAQRTIIDQAIETQEEINRQGLDLTRRAVKPLVDVAPAGRNATDRVDDAFDRLDETQSDVLGQIQRAAERPVDTSEDATEWGIDFVDRQVGRLQSAGETVEEVTGEVAESAEETVEETAEAAAETAEGVAEDADDAAQEAVETSEDVARVVDDLRTEFDAASDEYDVFEDVDERAAEGLAATGIETLSELATARPETVADATSTTQANAEEWIDAAAAHEGDAVSDLEGVGETYSDRLAATGIRTQDQLARTSAHEVAEIAEVSEDRAVDWVNRAQEQA